MSITVFSLAAIPTGSRVPNQWNTVDLNTVPGVIIPAGSTSVLIEAVVKTSYTSTDPVGVRPVGSQVNDLSDLAKTISPHFIPLNGGTSIQVRGAGYYRVVAVTNRVNHVTPIDLSASITSTSATVVSAPTLPTEASFAVVRLAGPATAAFGVRIGKVGETGSMAGYNSGYPADVIVPLNASKQFEYRGTIPSASNNRRLEVVGWLPAGAFHYHDAPQDFTTPGTNVWEAVSVGTTNFAMFGMYAGGNPTQVGVRPDADGASDTSSRQNPIRYVKPAANGTVQFYDSKYQDVASSFFLRGEFPDAAVSNGPKIQGVLGTDVDDPAVRYSGTAYADISNATTGAHVATIGPMEVVNGAYSLESEALQWGTGYRVGFRDAVTNWLAGAYIYAETGPEPV